MIHEFNPVIYPRKLWITYDATPDELNAMFPSGDSNGNSFKPEDDYYGITDRVTDNDHSYGILIRFSDNKESMDPWNIVHEAIHAAGMIFQKIGMIADFENDEAYAYLTAWIVKCCCEVRNK